MNLLTKECFYTTANADRQFHRLSVDGAVLIKIENVTYDLIFNVRQIVFGIEKTHMLNHL